jgi:hypothetical protein
MSAQDPRSEVDFGVWHDDRGSARAVWQAHSGQLVAIALAGPHAGQSAVLGLLPPSGHPDPRRSALIAEAVLAGWAQHSGRPASRAWLQDRLDALAGVRLETIDWTIACPIPGCPRHAEAISPHSAEWDETCERCLAARLVVAQRLSPSRLEALLRGGVWQLAEHS